jgi:hypothetical protein
MLVQGIKMTMNLSISGAKMDQFVVMLAWIPLAIPAILGLSHFVKESVKKSMTVIVSFSMYMISSIVTYSVYFQVTDPIASGLLFIILLYPVSIFSTVILGIIMYRDREVK